ncbi:MAG: carbohydrate ABC transporter permease [Anaerolineae bacterium]
MEWPPSLIPRPVTLSNYVEIWKVAPFALYTRNSVIIAVARVLGSILSATMVGFAFARLRFPGREVLFLLCLSTMMLPFVVTMIPSYVLFRMLGWVDTFLPLTVGAWLGPSFYVFLSRQFMRTLPLDYDEAARIDGANNWRIWLSVIMPNSKAVIATIGIFAFRASWNDFLGPLIFLNSQKNFTLALGLRSFQGYYRTSWTLLMAGSVMMIIPVLVAFFTLQRYFLQGIVFSGLAGR